MLNKNEIDEVLRCIYICQENYGKGNEYLQSAISKLESPQNQASVFIPVKVTLKEDKPCPWCSKKHKVKEGRVNKKCKCENPVMAVCTTDDYNGSYCPKCGAWSGVPEW